MSKITRENVTAIVEADLQSASSAAETARRFAVDCAQNNSISGSGERAVAEQTSANWEETVRRLVKLKKDLSTPPDLNGERRVSPPTLVEITINGDDEPITAIISETNVHLHTQEITVITPESPFGKAVVGKKEGEGVQYQVGKATLSARVSRIF